MQNHLLKATKKSESFHCKLKSFEISPSFGWFSTCSAFSVQERLTSFAVFIT